MLMRCDAIQEACQDNLPYFSLLKIAAARGTYWCEGISCHAFRLISPTCVCRVGQWPHPFPRSLLRAQVRPPAPCAARLQGRPSPRALQSRPCLEHQVSLLMLSGINCMLYPHSMEVLLAWCSKQTKPSLASGGPN